MNIIRRLSVKFFLKQLICFNLPQTRTIVSRLLPRWNIESGNGLGPLVGTPLAPSLTSLGIGGKPLNAAIVYLSRSRESDLKQLQKSLKLLKKNLINKFPYRVIIFHEDIDVLVQDKIKKIIPGLIDFEQIKFVDPEWISSGQSEPLPWRTGYCHMCNFFSGAIFEHPRMRELEWYMRLDIDSYILTPFAYDPFCLLAENGKSYGYLTTFYEQAAVSADLAECVQRFIQKTGIQPTFLQNHYTGEKLWNRLSFYTNFEVAKLDFWRSGKFKEFWRHIQEERGIYMNRWGDAPLHFIALSLFQQEDAIARLDGIGYRHVNYYSVP